jgi:hypothetical protein
MGILLLGASGFDQAKRSTINMTGPNAFSYAFINHMRQADGWCGVQDFIATTDPTLSNSVDADGWPVVQNKQVGGGPRIPGTDEFAGSYVLTWTGDGSVSIIGSTTWTRDDTTSLGNTSATYTGGGGSWSNASGQTAVVVIKPSNSPWPQLLGIHFQSTGTSNFAKDLVFCRQEDYADHLAGKVFRTGYLNMIKAYNPYAVRFLDYSATNDTMITRWEHRLLPTDASWHRNEGGVHQPKYTKVSGTPTNTLVLDSGGVSGMPVSMQHGELVSFRHEFDFPRTSGAKAITSITRNNTSTNTVVCNGHGFANGDTIQHQMHSETPGNTPAGMIELHDVPCVISNVSTNQYDISVNTFTYGAFTVGNAWQYITLNVGNRGAYPIVGYDGVSKAGRFTNYQVSATGRASVQRVLMFHKDIKASSTVTGAWLYPQSFYTGHEGLPIEIMVKFMNELNALGPKNTINMYYNLPAFGLAAIDQDYTSASDWAVNAIDCILNPASAVRAGGYSELNSACKLYVEFQNETWNFPLGYCQGRLGYQKWGNFDLGEYTAYRAAKIFNQLRAAFPTYSARLKTVLGMWTTFGSAGYPNLYRVTTSANQQTAMGSSAAMVTYYDYIAMAGYFEEHATNPTYQIAAGIAAMSAAAGNNAACEAAFATYAQSLSTQSVGGTETIDRYLSILADFAATAAAAGKGVIGYEGGYQSPDLSTTAAGWSTMNGTTSLTNVTSQYNNSLSTLTVGDYYIADGVPDFTRINASASGTATLSAAATASRNGHYITMDPTNAFYFYFKRSQAWADTYITWFNGWNSVSNAIAPPEFILSDAGTKRWSHDIEDAYLGGVEGGALDRAWLKMSLRNKQ